MLSQEADFEVVGTAEHGAAAIEQVAALRPDVVLMDVRMPVMDGREATRIICGQFPSTKVLVLSTFDDDQYITDSIRAGAKGYLMKDTPLVTPLLRCRLERLESDRAVMKGLGSEPSHKYSPIVPI